MVILESVVQGGGILQSNVVSLAVLESEVVYPVCPPGSGKVATVAAPSGTATHAMPSGTRMSDIVVFGAGGGTVTVTKQTTGGDLFTDEPYSSDGNPVLVRHTYFQAAETLGFVATGAVTIKIYYQ